MHDSSSTEIERRLNQARDAARARHPLAAADMYREILISHEPTNAAAYVELLDLHRGTDFKLADDEQLAGLRRYLGPGFRRHATPHFTLLSEADRSWTRRQAARLERAYDQFQRFAGHLNLRLIPPNRRLTCILFADRPAFADFARQQDGVTDPWIAGYYASEPNYSVFYDPRQGPAFADALAHLTAAEREYDELQAQWREASRKREQERSRLIQQRMKEHRTWIKAERRRLDDSAREAAAAKTVHEAVHQLAYNTAIQSEYRSYPFWISEGLATNFETRDTVAAFGPAHDFQPRRDQFRKLLVEGDLYPLEKLVALEGVRGGSGHAADIMYHQSYAIFMWVYRFRKAQLAEYFRLMSLPPGLEGAPPGGRLSAKEHAQLFRSCFGEPREIETAWLRWERSR